MTDKERDDLLCKMAATIVELSEALRTSLKEQEQIRGDIKGLLRSYRPQYAEARPFAYSPYPSTTGDTPAYTGGSICDLNRNPRWFW
jgi:hypothetical protein